MVLGDWWYAKQKIHLTKNDSSKIYVCVKNHFRMKEREMAKLYQAVLNTRYAKESNVQNPRH